MHLTAAPRLALLLSMLFAASCGGSDSSEEPATGAGGQSQEDAAAQGGAAGHAGAGGKAGAGGSGGKSTGGSAGAGGALDAGTDAAPDVEEDGGSDAADDADDASDASSPDSFADVTSEGEGGGSACSGACAAHVFDACTCGAADPCGWVGNGTCEKGCHEGGFALEDEADCDRDEDGLWDHVELELARAFTPSLILSANEYYADRVTFWAAAPSQGNTYVSVFYALGYLQDGGDPETGLTDHLGDSEFVVVDATTDDGVTWTPLRVFMSAHYKALSDSSGWYDAADVDFDTSDGLAHPFTWVAVWKHANYPTIQACDKGAFFMDKCDNGKIERAEVREDANLGSAAHPLIDEVLSQQGGTSYFEYYWTDVPFCGWQVASKLAADRDGCVPEANSYQRQLADWLGGSL